LKHDNLGINKHVHMLCINYQLDAQIFFIYIISLYMFRALMLIFRRSHYVYTQHMVSSLFRSSHGGCRYTDWV